MMNSRLTICGTLVATAFFFVVAFVDSGSASRLKRSDSWMVTTIVEPPYVINLTAVPTKNEDFDGYIPDMLKLISKHMNQPYTLRLVKSGSYGSQDSQGRWSGMIGEVHNNEAILAAAPITISDPRKLAVDFTVPFMAFGTVILQRKPDNGSEVRIKNIHQLGAADQTEVKFGTVKDGMTETLLKTSHDPALKRIGEHIIKLDSQQEGVNKVIESHGKFAMILEANTAEYWVQKKCNLVMHKIDDIPNRDYAFALAKNSPNTERVNTAIRELKAKGDLEKLKAKWWKEQCNASTPVGPITVTTGLLVLLSFVALKM